MKKVISIFSDSLNELKKTKTITIISMLIAIAVVIGSFAIAIGDFIKISFAFLPNEITGMLFGPVAGGIMAGIADILKFIVRPTGPYFFGFTFNAILGGVLYGVFLYKKPINLKRIFIAKLVVMIIINVFLNTYWLSLMYGKAFFVLLPIRILKETIMMPIETAMLYTVAKSLEKIPVFDFVKSNRNVKVYKQAR